MCDEGRGGGGVCCYVTTKAGTRSRLASVPAGFGCWAFFVHSSHCIAIKTGHAHATLCAVLYMQDHPGTAFEKVQKVQTKRKMAQDSAGVSAYIKGATSHSSSSSSGLIWEHGQLKSSAHHVAAVSVWWLLLGIVTWHLANLC